MLGVGVDTTSAPTAPVLIAVPEREATLLGVGSGESADARDVSLAIDLITKKPPSVRPATEVAEPAAPAKAVEAAVAVVAVVPVESARPLAVEPEVPAADRDSVAPPPRRGSGGKWLLLLVVAGAAGAGYMYRDHVLVYWHVAVTEVTRQLR